MATTKTTKTARPAATKRATPTNGSKPTATKMTVTPKKKLEEMTDEEIGLLAWETSYKNRHKRLDQ